MADKIRNPKRPIVLDSLDVLVQQVKQDFVTNVQVDAKVQAAVSDNILFGTKAEWEAQPDFVPKHGALVIYADYAKEDGKDIPNFKVGDGNAYLVDLPFSQDDLRAALAAHILDTSKHLSDEDRTKLAGSVTATATQQTTGDFTLVLSKD